MTHVYIIIMNDLTIHVFESYKLAYKFRELNFDNVTSLNKFPIMNIVDVNFKVVNDPMYSFTKEQVRRQTSESWVFRYDDQFISSHANKSEAVNRAVHFEINREQGETL